MNTTKLISLLLLLPSTALAQDPAFEATKELYIAKCASCHSVGGGDRVGPDLKGVVENRARDWLVKMIGTPSQLLGSDPDARALLAKYNNIKMPDLGLDDAQVSALIDLLDRCSKEACVLKGKLVPVTKATKADIKRGHDLFVGRESQENGGPPCISCHSAQGANSILAGGILSKDLTNSFARLGDEGLDAALKNPAFEVMNKVYGDRPLKTEEVFALRAFLYTTNRGATDELEGSSGHAMAVPLVGILLVVIVLMLLNAAWSRRLSGVRQPLVNKKGLQQ